MSQVVQAIDGTQSFDSARKNTRLIFAAVIGHALEWYDFFVFGSLSTILAAVFFPQEDRVVAVILTLAIFAVGFVARPLGGLVFGHIGDRHGRKRAFILSVLLMAIPALTVALLPTYDQIGRLAPFILLVCRILQGFAGGGEMPVAVTYVTELATPKQRGYLGSLLMVAAIGGVLLATLVVTIVTHLLSETDMYAWGWRIPFALTVVSVGFGYYLRMKLLETGAFGDLKRRDKVHKHPVLQSLKTTKKPMLIIFMFGICAGAVFYSYNVFIMTYLKEIIKIGYEEALYVSIASSCFLMVFVALSGLLSDRLGRRKIMITGTLCFICFSYPLYTLYAGASFVGIILVQAGFAAIASLILGPAFAFLTEQVEASVRCTSIALAYNLAFALFAGTAPMISVLLIQTFKTDIAPSFYLIFAAIVGTIAIFFAQDRQGQALA